MNTLYKCADGLIDSDSVCTCMHDRRTYCGTLSTLRSSFSSRSEQLRNSLSYCCCCRWWWGQLNSSSWQPTSAICTLHCYLTASQ